MTIATSQNTMIARYEVFFKETKIVGLLVVVVWWRGTNKIDFTSKLVLVVKIFAVCTNIMFGSLLIFLFEYFCLHE